MSLCKEMIFKVLGISGVLFAIVGNLTCNFSLMFWGIGAALFCAIVFFSNKE
jgi:hypothetical protein